MHCIVSIVLPLVDADTTSVGDGAKSCLQNLYYSLYSTMLTVDSCIINNAFIYYYYGGNE